MNMVERVGNYERHRTAPIIKQVLEDGKVRYEVQFLPVVSGQSIANAYTRALVDIALRRGLPVCKECSRYNELNGFPKRPNIEGEGDSVDKRVTECVVEDVTGFMVTQSGDKSSEGRAFRRTSRIEFSFLIPDVDSANHVPPMSQIHVRYGEKETQTIYNIESASAIYTLVVNIDVDGIGKGVKSTTSDRETRVKTSLDALMLMLNGSYVGAKKSRYFPQIEPLGAVAVVSDPYPFVVSPPKAKLSNDGTLQPWYLEDTLRRAVAFKGVFTDASLAMYYLDNEFNWSPGSIGDSIKVVRVEDINSLIASVKEIIKVK
jgi:CRISPR-associated protein Cas7/Csa2 subtype I-A